MTVEATGADRAESLPRGYQASGGLVPVPDPTLLTTSLVEKAVEGLRAELIVQFAAMAEATKLVRDAHDKLVNDFPLHIAKSTDAQRDLWTATLASTEERIKKLDEVSKEQFARIAIQFDERDKRTEQLSQAQKEAANALSLASATAIAAALQAQKEAAGAQNDSNAASITKSEAAFTKQIDQMAVLVQQIQKGNDDKVSDLKAGIAALASRLDRGEGSTTGARDVRVEQRSGAGQTIAMAVMLSGFISVLIAVTALFVHRAVG